MQTYIRRQQHKKYFKHQDIKQKEPPQKYRLGTISNTKLLAGLNRFYIQVGKDQEKAQSVQVGKDQEKAQSVQVGKDQEKAQTISCGEHARQVIFRLSS